MSWTQPQSMLPAVVQKRLEPLAHRAIVELIDCMCQLGWVPPCREDQFVCELPVTLALMAADKQKGKVYIRFSVHNDVRCAPKKGRTPEEPEGMWSSEYCTRTKNWDIECTIGFSHLKKIWSTGVDSPAAKRVKAMVVSKLAHELGHVHSPRARHGTPEPTDRRGELRRSYLNHPEEVQQYCEEYQAWSFLCARYGLAKDPKKAVRTNASLSALLTYWDKPEREFIQRCAAAGFERGLRAKRQQKAAAPRSGASRTRRR